MENVTLKINEFFAKLEFDATQHRYNVSNENLISVSGLLKDFQHPFERDGIARGVAEKRRITSIEVIAEWDANTKEACDRGHRVHDFAERYVWDRTLIPSCGQEKAVVKFWSEIPPHIVPVIAEIKMYHRIFKYAGTADILLYNTETRKFIIGDYKTNKDLFKNYKDKRLKYPFAYMKDSPYNKYQLQLSFYQMLFQQLGYVVEKRKIIWLKPNGTYNMYDTESFESELKHYLISRN